MAQAGQEEFDSITKSYYRGAAGCVVAFSTTDRGSFDAVCAGRRGAAHAAPTGAARRQVEGWIKKVEAEVDSVPMALVQNKVDLIEGAVMTKEEAEQKAEKVGLKFYRTSVQENYNVNEVFTYLAKMYLARVKAEEDARRSQSAKTKPAFAATGTATAAAPADARPDFRSGAGGAGGSSGAIRLDAPRKQRATAKKGGPCSVL